MGTSTTAAAVAAATGPEDPRVTRFLSIRYKLRKRKDKLSATLDAAAEKLDRRATQEDFLRRRERLAEQVRQARETVAVASDPALKAAANKAEAAIKAEDATVETALKQDQRPEYGAARTRLRGEADALTAALDAAGKRAADRRAGNPALFRTLGGVAAMLERDRALVATADAKGWTDRREAIEKALHDGSKPVATLMPLAEALDHEVRLKLTAAAVAARQVSTERTRLIGAMARVDASPASMAEADAALNQAARQATALDFAAARQSLAAAAKLIGPAASATLPPPRMADCENERQTLHNRASALVPGTRADGTAAGGGGAVSPAARRRAVALLHRLDDLKGLCAQSDDVAVDAAQQLKGCQVELDAILEQDDAAVRYQPIKAGVAAQFDKDIAALKQALAAQAPRDGALAAIETRVALLEQGYADKWPALMVQADVDRSGLLTELAALETLFHDWTEARAANAAPPGWQDEFQAARDRLARLTEQAGKQDVGLLTRFELLTRMPKLVSEAGGLLTAADPAAGQARVEQITRDLTTQANLVETQLSANGPQQQQQNQVAGLKLADALAARVDATLALFDAAKPGAKEAWGKKQLKRVRSSLFSDDDERALRRQYGEAVKTELDALGTMLRCKDPSAQAEAARQLDAMQARVAAFQAMGATLDKPQAAVPGAPPTFLSLSERIKAVEKLLGKHAKDKQVGSRVEALKGWTDRAGALADRLGSTEPAALAAEIDALQADIDGQVPKMRLEAVAADRQLKLVQALSLTLRDRRKNLHAKYAALADELARRCDAMIEDLGKWRMEDPGYAQLRDSIVALLKPTRSADEEAATEKLRTEADAGAKAMKEAKDLLLKLIDVDLKLRREKFSGIGDGKLRKLMGKLADDLAKEAERTLDALKENRDPSAAKSFVEAALRELDQTGMSAQGDKLTRRGDLARLDTLWGDSVGRLKAQLAALERAVEEATAGGPDDARQAAQALKATGTGQVAALFVPTAFKASLTALDDDDADTRATHRELVLREVRRLRRVMESDQRVRMLAADNPFGVPIPLPEIESRLFDIEVNATRFAGS